MSWDAINQEIVVTASIQGRNYVASWFRTGADKSVAANGGVQYWGGPKLGVLESGRQIVTVFGRGIWTAAKGLGTVALTGLAAESNIPGVSHIARSQIRDVGRRISDQLCRTG